MKIKFDRILGYIREGDSVSDLTNYYTKEEINLILEELNRYDGYVTYYDDLPAANTAINKLYIVTDSQGTQWLPGSLGGTYYAKGFYFSNGVSWIYLGEFPHQATTSEVDNEILDNVFITPASLKYSLGDKSYTELNTTDKTILGSIDELDIKKADKSYVDGLVTGLLDYRGGYNASGGVFPTEGGSGIGGTVLKGDMWVISVAGTLGGQPVQVGDSIIANIDYPINSLTNWDILNSNISYVPEDVANKKTTMTGNESSDTSYLSAKAVYDWVTSLGGGGSQTYEVFVAGELTTGRLLRQTVKTTQTLSGVKITCDTLPTGADLQVQVYKNGIASTNSIFTSDTPISITTGQSATNGVYTTTKTTIDNGTLAENDIIYIYITQIGSTLSSTNLSVICY